MERGLSNELVLLIDFLNDAYAADSFNRVEFAEVQRLAGTCVTGCQIVDSGPIPDTPGYDGFTTRLADLARAAAGRLEVGANGSSRTTALHNNVTAV